MSCWCAVVAYERAVRGEHVLREIESLLPRIEAMVRPTIFAIARTDLIVTVPRRLAKITAATAALRLVEPPREIKGFPYFMVWHPRLAAEHCARPVPRTVTSSWPHHLNRGLVAKDRGYGKLGCHAWRWLRSPSRVDTTTSVSWPACPSVRA